MGNLLTMIIGTVAKGPAAKGRAGGLAGLVLMAGEPAWDAFATGFSTGALPQIEQVGVILGQAIIGYAVGYLTTYFAPANKSA